MHAFFFLVVLEVTYVKGLSLVDLRFCKYIKVVVSSSSVHSISSFSNIFVLQYLQVTSNVYFQIRTLEFAFKSEFGDFQQYSSLTLYH